MSNSRHKIIDQYTTSSSVDQGLRSYMLKVYAYMFVGLSITGALAFLVTQSPELQNILFTQNAAGQWGASGVTLLLSFAQIGLVLFLSFRIQHLMASTAQLIFWGYSALMGLSLSSLFLLYTGSSTARVFLITSATFGTMSLYGYVTKKDLSRLGSFLFMALIGIIIASLANLFFKSSAMEFVISVLGVLVFTGLTAYDTQRVKEIYWEHDSSEVRSKKAIMGALALYLDFINLFVLLMRFLGDRR